jgi:hypothetical protein
MRPLSIVLAGLVVAVGFCSAAGSARLGGTPLRVLVNTNDRFDVRGTHISCHVSRRAAGFANHLLCVRATTPLSSRAPRGSYALEITAAGVEVARVGSKQAVFRRPLVAPAGAPAGSAGATAVLGGSTVLKTRADKVFVAGTNIVCRPFGTLKLSLLCVLLGQDGHIHDGTYLAFISDHSVIIALARNGKPVTVFQRVHGR